VASKRENRSEQEQKEQENQHELEILQELLPKDGYVDDLTSPDENSPYVEQKRPKNAKNVKRVMTATTTRARTRMRTKSMNTS
jgi:hypothetical protein